MPTASPILAWLVAYRYAIVYPLAIIEGPILSIISGFLVRTGFFAFWPIYLLLMAGDLTGDAVWYAIGRHGALPFIKRFGRFFNMTGDDLEKMQGVFLEHQKKILFISKLTTGFGFAVVTLMAAGAARVPFKKYITINFFGQFIWTGALMAVGFFLGNLYSVIDKSLRWGFIVAMILLALLLVYGFGKAMKKGFGKKIFK